MRQLSREEDVAAPPRRPGRWRRPAILAASGAVLLLALAAAGWSLRHGGVAAEVAAALERRALAWSARFGLALGEVQVEGRERASRAAVLGALAVARGTPILAIDPAEAKRRLETIPWIRSASVERRLPDTLLIRLVERRPLAFWQRKGTLVLIDREGAVIPSERLDAFGNLVVLVGNDAPAKGAQLLDMLASEPDLARHVAAAVRVGGRRWNLRLDNGIDIALPEEDPLAAWHRLAELERSQGLLERGVELVDLRLPDRLVLRLPESRKTPSRKGRTAGGGT